MPTLRPPAVAGSFYPGNPVQLAGDVQKLLAAAPVGYTDHRPPKAIIAPHAGYIYSGSTAAAVYARLIPWRNSIHRVVLLGPAHRVAVAGLAIPSVDFFATPLGNIPLDRAALDALSTLPQVQTSDQAHVAEHSLEVHLPFMQMVLGTFSLLPVVVGHAAPAIVADVLEHLWGGPETLIVVSTDLSHFLPYAQARQVDQATCQQILCRQSTLHPEQACGAFPVNGLLLAAQQHRLKIELVGACNSGDTAGDTSRVVGYAAFTLQESEALHV